MKISYILQLKDFLIMLVIGVILGMLYGILNIVFKFKKITYLQIIVDTAFTLVFFTTLIIAVNIINLGQYRTFLLVGYILGFILERISLGKLFAKFYKFVYTYIVSLFSKLAKTNIGRFILK